MRYNMRNKIDNSGELKYRQTTAFVFDRFYRSDISPVWVLLGRFLIAAAIAFMAVGYVFSQYDVPVNSVALSFGAVGFTAAFSLVFAFVKRRVAVPVIAIVAGIIIIWGFEAFWEKFSYFYDGFVLQFNGRIFDTTTFTVHPLRQIELNGVYSLLYVDGVTFGSVILCALFSLITAAGLIGKPHILPSLVSFVILLSPLMASERLRFDPRIVPLVALYAGALAVGIYYRDGLAIRQVYVVGGYRRKIQMDDRRFNASAASQSFTEKTAARGLRYSKYFSSIISAAAIFTAIGFIVSFVCRDSTGINYQPLYELFAGVDVGSSGSTPFRTGPEANYFVSPTTSIFGSQGSRMQLTSPSRSTKEILRVTKSVGVKPVYLRGDIGIDFDGASWSSAVVDNPTEWREKGLDKEYLPIEQEALSECIFNYYSGYDINLKLVSESGVTVEYLCDTDVVFTPAYDSGFKVFGSNEYSVFGDFAARRRGDKSTGDTLIYTAKIPTYMDGSSKTDLGFFRAALLAYDKNVNGTQWDSSLSSQHKQFGSEMDCQYEKYKSYVYNNYLGVPESLKTSLDEFMEKSGLNSQRESELDFSKNTASTVYENKETETLLDRYISAMTVSQFLKDNYTYSLDTRIDKRDPVMSFLEDTKSGHCALYASAMTLILREWGIPARYCTGFAASADLKMQTLRSKDLHAWCEVYLDGMGWITFDPTASAIFGGTSQTSETSSAASVPENSVSNPTQSADSSQAYSSTPAIAPASTPESSGDPTTYSTFESSDISAEETRFTFRQILPYLLTILGIAAGAAVIVLAVVAYVKLKNRADKKIQSFHRDGDSERVYAKMVDILRFCGLFPASGEQPHDFFKRAEESLGVAICDNYELLERLAFGEAELDTSERAILGFVLEKIYRAAESRFTPVGKVRLRLMIIRGR